MTTREEVYAKFGVTAEAAQLFETELGTILLAVSGIENGWFETPNPSKARQVLDQIETHTLGRLIGTLRNKTEIDDNLDELFESALKARNRLNHGFYERHNFKIQSDKGREAMIADLDQMHDELFRAWQLAASVGEAVSKIIPDLRADALVREFVHREQD